MATKPKTKPCLVCGTDAPLRTLADGKKVMVQQHIAPCGAWCVVGSGSISARLLHGAVMNLRKSLVRRDCPMGCDFTHLGIVRW